MIEKVTLYRASCDKCSIRCPVAAPKSSLVTYLRMNGWRVDKDTVICSECVEKEVRE